MEIFETSLSSPGLDAHLKKQISWNFYNNRTSVVLQHKVEYQLAGVLDSLAGFIHLQENVMLALFPSS